MTNKTIATGMGLMLAVLSTTLQASTWQTGILTENSRSPFIGDETETSSMPMINYIGERFSFVGGKIQYGLISGEKSETYLVSQIRQHQFYSASLDSGDDRIDGMQNRDSAFELGTGLKIQTTQGQYVLEGLVDIAGVHDGFELTARYSYPRQFGRWLLEPAIGVQLQSSNLTNYYHGVMDSEAQLDRPSYEAGQAINKIAMLTVGYQVNAKLLALAGLEQIELNTAITDSPIVSMNHVRKVFLGLIYTF